MATFSCTCEYCQYACTYRPGWFRPGEAEKAAKGEGMTLKDFFDRYLAVDWWEGTEDLPETFVLAPAIKGEGTGEEYPGDPRGPCIFFKKGRCSIYANRPYECRKLSHDDDNKTSIPARHKAVVKAWAKPKHQKQITSLLGREPETSSFYGGFGLLGLF